MSVENTGGIPLRLKEPNVKLPKAVRLQKENVDRLLTAKSNEIKAAVEEKFKADTPTGSHSTPTEAAVPNAEPKKTEVQPTEVPVAVAVKNEPTKDAAYWEHRFKTNQGIHEAEKTRYKGVVTSLESRVNELEKALTDSNKRVPRELDVSKYVNEHDLETYGKDMLSTVARTANKIADEAAEHRIKETVTSEINPLKVQLEETQKQLAKAQQEKFWDHLNNAVNEWPAVNNDQRFHDWLAEIDPFTGYPRQQLLTNAEQALDSSRVVAIFKAFLQTIPASVKPTEADLAKQVVPEPIGQTAQGTASQAEVVSITRAEISRYYKDKAVGRYKLRPQDAELMEKKIKAAIASGNVF